MDPNQTQNTFNQPQTSSNMNPNQSMYYERDTVIYDDIAPAKKQQEMLAQKR